MNDKQIPLMCFDKSQLQEVMKLLSGSALKVACIVCEKQTVEKGFYFPSQKFNSGNNGFFVYSCCPECRQISANLNKIEKIILEKLQLK